MKKSDLALPAGSAIADEAEEAVALALDRLTETQRRRLLARLGGATLQQIGDAEGVSTSAVDQSLKTSSVRAVMQHLTMYTVRDGIQKKIDPLVYMIQVIMEIAANATRSVVVSVGGGITRVKEVPDYSVRLAAATKFLSLIDSPAPTHAKAAPDRPTGPAGVELEQEETTSTRRRVRLSRP